MGIGQGSGRSSADSPPFFDHHLVVDVVSSFSLASHLLSDARVVSQTILLVMDQNVGKGTLSPHQESPLSATANTHIRDSADYKGLRNIIRKFTPAWFASVMGTGAVSLLFHTFPYGNETEPMKVLTLIIFLLNLVLFVVFTAITIARYFMYPDVWRLMMRHPVQSLYLGCFPMAGTTLINLSVTVIHQKYEIGGIQFLYAIWGLWWLDVAIAIVCCWGLVHIMQTRQNHTLERMTSIWILPVVTLIVASSSGGILASALETHSRAHALLTITASACMVTIGLSLSLMMLTVYLLRLIVHGLPPGATIISVFLPLGPSGQASYSILLVGQAFKSMLPLRHGTSLPLDSASAGDTINIICICISFALWSFALMWIVFALLGISDVLRKTRYPFKLPFWGLIFPNGVYANLTISLSETFDSSFFRIFGAVYAVATVILWAGVTVRTIMLLRNAQIFEAPCLAEDADLMRGLLQEPRLPAECVSQETSRIV